MTVLSDGHLEGIIHHVFLPPKVPQSEDLVSETLLPRIVLDAVRAIEDRYTEVFPQLILDNAIAMLDSLCATSAEGFANDVELRQRIHQLPVGRMLAVNVRAQNAAVLVTRTETQWIFECFELSPCNNAVMSTKGRLVRTFPSKGVAINVEMFEVTDLINTIATTLAKMCQQDVPGMQPTTSKTGVAHSEDRDTTDPFAVSGLLFGVLTGIGTSATTVGITKHTREDVLWRNTKLPWRRSPAWLLIRVALQLVITRTEGGSIKRYKEVMTCIMSHILDLAQQHKFDVETVFIIEAKITRRMFKLGDDIPVVLDCALRSSLSTSHKTLNDKWRVTQLRDQKKSAIDLSQLQRLDFNADSYVSVPKLEQWLMDDAKRTHNVSDNAIVLSSNLVAMPIHEWPSLEENASENHAERIANLHTFEIWVARTFKDLPTDKFTHDTPAIVHKLLENYHRIARKLYDGSPEAISAMLLTIYSLWVLCDRAATHLCPLLGQYNPGIPIDVLQNLLLRSGPQMQQLLEIEQHLESRAGHHRTSELFDAASAKSFAVRFFDSSKTHKELLEKITGEGQRAYDAKVKELDNKRRELSQLEDLASPIEHQYQTIIVDDFVTPPETREDHMTWCCTRCDLESRYNAISIVIQEWPITKGETLAKTTVFELQVPPFYESWRDCRNFLLHDVLLGHHGSSSLPAPHLLSVNDPHLTKYYKGSDSSRITLLSNTKPTAITHFKNKSIPGLSLDELCVPNGLHYRYFEKHIRAYFGDIQYNFKVQEACTYELATAVLRPYVFRPASQPDGPAPNLVIAEQRACPGRMSLEEYRDLATVPLGHLVQWLNINKQLIAPSVNFRSADTVLLFLQCINQAGPGNGHWSRSGHDILSDRAVVSSLIGSLKSSMQRLQGNWEAVNAFALFASIATRIYTLNDSFRQECLEILANIRAITLVWVGSLQDKADEAKSDGDRAEFSTKCVQAALICAATFDVDDNCLANLLTYANNVSVLIQMIVVIHDNAQVRGSRTHLETILRFRYARLLHRSLSRVPVDSEGLDDAIRQIWASYVPSGEGWEVIDTHGQWLATTTDASRGMQGRQVHLNLLDGQLLIDGLPLDQTPAQYKQDDLYNVLFGNSAVKVMPGSVRGYTFSTKKTYNGYSVQLGLSPTNELIVQARKDSDVLTLVPSHVLTGTFPSAYLADYVHWYNMMSKTLEFRPREHPWTSNLDAHWILSRRGISEAWQAHSGSHRLFGLGTPTSKAVCSVLSTLAYERDIHITDDVCASDIHIEIPALRLTFSLSPGSSRLLSKDHAAMYVDGDQSVGCLIGLASKLVLRSDDGVRLLLVPESEISYQRQLDHMTVTIAKGEEVQLHAYTIDTLLNRIIDTGSLRSKLFLAYLHALTSSCLADPLTCKTGTESALTILTSAVVYSQQQITRQDVHILELIAALSPARGFYPHYLQNMQSIAWDSRLQALSQHSWYRTRVDHIYAHYRRSLIYHPGTDLPSMKAASISQHLLDRACIQTSTFRIDGFGAEDHTAVYDVLYHSRCDGNVATSSDVAKIAGQVHANSSARHMNAPSSGSLWRLFVDAKQPANGVRVTSQLKPISYDARLLSKSDGHDYSIVNFLPLQRALARMLSQHKYDVLMFLASLAFAKTNILDLVQTLAMSTHLSSVLGDNLTEAKSFDAQQGTDVNKNDASVVISRHVKRYDSCAEYQLPRHYNERASIWHQRRHTSWQKASNAAVQDFTRAVLQQWPTTELHFRAIDRTWQDYINIENAVQDLDKLFKERHNNLDMSRYLAELEVEMAGLLVATPDLPSTSSQVVDTTSNVASFVTETSFFAGPCLASATDHPVVSAMTESSDADTASTLQPLRLRKLMEALEMQPDITRYEQRYIEALRSSSAALSLQGQDYARPVAVTESALQVYLERCEKHMARCYKSLVNSVDIKYMATAVSEVEMMPRFSTALFLRQLNRNNWTTLSSDWREGIVRYALSITAVQQSKRLLKLANRHDLLAVELSNIGHTTWDPMQKPEDLLIEIENDILIRELQARVASQMIDPYNGTNSTVQLNMGEGKTSVLVPVTAIAVTRRDELPVVVVGKPQSKQMAEMLRSKLGGLIDRRIYFMPFSRSLQFDTSAVRTVLHMIEECKAQGGILLLQPEHILSFQLMGPEMILGDHADVSQWLSIVQDFLDRHSRYIVDECDDNFSVRFELIYSIGEQKIIDGGSTRWNLLQEVLELVRKHCPDIVKNLPDGIEVRQGLQGSFPRTRILQEAAKEKLIHALADDICKHGVENLPINRQQQAMRDNIYIYLTKKNIDPAEVVKVEKSGFWTESTKDSLVLLRGLLAGDILAFVLSSKRWRVHYGPTVRSPLTRLAVPYSAKDCPSPRSEFSHPDVVILLTSLSFYYEGLSSDDLFSALSHLLNSDEPENEYAAWTKDSCNLPIEFKEIRGINIKDKPQCVTRLFPALRYSKAAIDYFLNKLVFPKEMKEYPNKLSASGWDIGKNKMCLTTGFSGTSDAKYLLPTMVQHFDLPESEHTNALVLEYLLQPVNTVHLIQAGASIDSDAQCLLSAVAALEPAVQVILDVGAQVVEMTNKAFAASWLASHNASKEGVVYVDDQDVICVQDRQGRCDPLQNSPFASRLSACLVFLDEAHTRGIDLKLPTNYRAAVTLGAHLTKDRLVQACMRMRQLGKGQTVVFCIREEIQRRIRETTSQDQMSVLSVLRWTMSETLTELRRYMPLWATQGQRYFQQKELWTACKTNGQTKLTRYHAEQLLEAEAQTLEKRYRPFFESRETLHGLGQSANHELKLIAERCQEFDNLDFDSTSLQEEQEREVAAEIEQEREVQRPPKAHPQPHSLHPLVEHFAYTGDLDMSAEEFSEAFTRAFNSLKRTSGAAKFAPGLLARDKMLLVTMDFARTVQLGAKSASDNYQRSVQWVLTSCSDGSNTVKVAIIISPYEANLLVEGMRTSKTTALHSFKARCNVTHRSFDDLAFCTITARDAPPVVPRRLVVQLALFSGQLYISSYDHYKEMCALLGLAIDGSNTAIDADGFIQEDDQGRQGGASGLTKSPVNFMQFHMSTVRRNGESIIKTHVGRVLRGQLLQESDFDPNH